MRALRRAGSLLLAAAVTLCFSGCMHSIRLKERAIVQAVGVDYVRGGYQLTMLYFTPSDTGGEKAYDAADSGGILSSWGKTMSEAVENAAQLQGRSVFFGSNKMIILGRAMASAGIDAPMDFFNANHQLHPSMYVLLAQDAAADILNAPGTDPAVVEKIAKTAADHRHMNGGTMLDVVTGLEDGRSAVDIPVIHAQKDGMRIDGAGLISGGTLVDTLTQKEIEGIIWMRGKAGGSLMSLELPDGGRCSIEILGEKTKKRARIGEEGNAVFEVEISADCALRENLSPGRRGRDLLEEAERLAGAKVRQLIRQTLERTTPYGADLFEFEELLRQRQPQFYAANRDQMQEVMQNADYQFKISCNLSRMGLEAAENKR